MSWLHWSLLSAFFAAITAIFAKSGVAGIDSNLATAIRTAVVLVLSCSIVAGTGSIAGIRSIPASGWWALVLSGLATGASWLCYFRALQTGPVSRVAPIDKLSVAFVLVLAAVFLREPLTLSKALGGVLIVAGSILVAR